MKLKKIQAVPFNQIAIRFTGNPRVLKSVDQLNDPGLQLSLTDEGQRTECAFEKMEGDELAHWRKFYNNPEIVYGTLRGEHRTYNLMQLGKQGAKGPDGQPFTTVNAVIYEDLTPAERNTLRREDVKPYTKADLLKEWIDERTFGTPTTAIQRARKFRRQMDNMADFKKPTPEDLANDTTYHAFRAGVVNEMDAIFVGPILLREACFDKFNGKQSWPGAGEIKKLSAIFVGETKPDADPAGQYSKSNPGPKFMEQWNAMLKNVEKAKETGSKPAKVGMLTRDVVEQLLAQTDVQPLKIQMMIFLQVGGWSPTDQPALSEAVKLLLSGDVAGYEKSVGDLTSTKTVVMVEEKKVA